MATVCNRDINGVLGSNVVGASTIGTGDVFLIVRRIEWRVFVSLVVVNPEGTEIFEATNPEDAAGVDIASTDAIDAFNKHTPSDHLLGRSVAVAGKNIHVRTATKPENAERKFEPAVIRFHRVGNVAVLVRPVC